MLAQELARQQERMGNRDTSASRHDSTQDGGSSRR